MSNLVDSCCSFCCCWGKSCVRGKLKVEGSMEEHNKCQQFCNGKSKTANRCNVRLLATTFHFTSLFFPCFPPIASPLWRPNDIYTHANTHKSFAFVSSDSSTQHKNNKITTTQKRSKATGNPSLPRLRISAYRTWKRDREIEIECRQSICIG